MGKSYINLYFGIFLEEEYKEVLFIRFDDLGGLRVWHRDRSFLRSLVISLKEGM